MKVWSAVISQVNTTNVWVDEDSENVPSFVRMAQVHTDKTAIKLKSNAIVAYSIHFILPNVMKNFKRSSIHHSYTLTAFLPVFRRLNEADSGGWT